MGVARVCVLLALGLIAAVERAHADPHAVEQALREALAGPGPVRSQATSFTYSNWHGLWRDGMTVTVHADGRVIEEPNASGEDRSYSISPAEVRALLELLVEIRGWEQRPLRIAPPDERHCRLTISIGGHRSEIVEWGRDLHRNDRLFRLDARLRRLGPTRPQAVPGGEAVGGPVASDPIRRVNGGDRAD